LILSGVVINYLKVRTVNEKLDYIMKVITRRKFEKIICIELGIAENSSDVQIIEAIQALKTKEKR